MRRADQKYVFAVTTRKSLGGAMGISLGRRKILEQVEEVFGKERKPNK